LLDFLGFKCLYYRLERLDAIVLTVAPQIKVALEAFPDEGLTVFFEMFRQFTP